MVDKQSGKWLDANEIKQRLSIEEVLRHYDVAGSMKRSGDTLRGPSPFHDGDANTFSANITRNIWNDQPRPEVGGEVVKGNVIGLIMAFEGVSFRAALERSYEIAGVVPGTSAIARDHDRTRDGRGATREQVRAVVPNVLENEPFGRQLSLKYDHPALSTMGLSPARARYWGVGWVPRGLLRGRLGVPIRNRSGGIVAYAGRSLRENDPNGEWRFPNGFHRSLELFNVDRVATDKETIAAVARHGLIVTQDIFDTIWLWENGFKNAVSTMGFDASDRQCEVLVDSALNPTRRITIFFGNNDTGRRGRKDICSRLLYTAFIRYIDFRRISADDRTFPRDFKNDELSVLLKYDRAQYTSP